MTDSSQSQRFRGKRALVTGAGKGKNESGERHVPQMVPIGCLRTRSRISRKQTDYSALARRHRRCDRAQARTARRGGGGREPHAIRPGGAQEGTWCDAKSSSMLLVLAPVDRIQILSGRGGLVIWSSDASSHPHDPSSTRTLCKYWPWISRTPRASRWVLIADCCC